MKFIAERHARFTLFQYIFSNLYIPTDIQEVIDLHLMVYFNYNPCLDLLNLLKDKYLETENKQREIMVTLFQNNPFDNAVLAMILCALTEMEINKETKLIVSEYTKLSLVCEINHQLVNGALNKILQHPTVQISSEVPES